MTKTTFASGALSVVTLGLVLAGPGCKNDEPAPTTASFCAQKAEKECGTAAKGVAANCGATDLAPCKTQRTAVCADWVLTQMTATRPFRPDAIGNCLAKTADAYAGAVVTPDKVAMMDDACARVFSGNNMGVPLKDPSCTNDYECAVGFICDKTFCTKKTVSVTGFCGDPGTVCPADQYCTLLQGANRCVPSKTLNQPCDAATPCISTLRCGSAGLCVAKSTLNGACVTNADCATDAPYCDPYLPTGCSCRVGFTPVPGIAQCGAFGGPGAGSGIPMVCTGSTGAGGAPGGAAGSTGSAGAAGTAGISGSAGAPGTAGAGGAGGAG